MQACVAVQRDVQVLGLPVLILSLFDLVRESPSHASNRLPFPRAHLRRLSVFARKHLPVIGGADAWQRSPAPSCHQTAPQAPLQTRTCLKSSVASSFSYPFIRVGYTSARCPILLDHFRVGLGGWVGLGSAGFQHHVTLSRH
jgi:hypothetical protein